MHFLYLHLFEQNQAHCRVMTKSDKSKFFKNRLFCLISSIRVVSTCFTTLRRYMMLIFKKIRTLDLGEIAVKVKIDKLSEFVKKRYKSDFVKTHPPCFVWQIRITPQVIRICQINDGSFLTNSDNFFELSEFVKTENTYEACVRFCILFWIQIKKYFRKSTLVSEER